MDPVDMRDDRKVQFRVIVDNSSIELFAQDGTVLLTDLFFPSEPFQKVELFSEDGTSKLLAAQFYNLETIHP